MMVLHAWKWAWFPSDPTRLPDSLHTGCKLRCCLPHTHTVLLIPLMTVLWLSMWTLLFWCNALPYSVHGVVMWCHGCGTCTVCTRWMIIHSTDISRGVGVLWTPLTQWCISMGTSKYGVDKWECRCNHGRKPVYVTWFSQDLLWPSGRTGGERTRTTDRAWYQISADSACHHPQWDNTDASQPEGGQSNHVQEVSWNT